MKIVKKKNRTRILRKARTRARTRGSASRPRLSVFRSNTNLYAQLIDDKAGKTLVAGSLRDIKSPAKAEGMNAPASPTTASRGGRIAKAFALGKIVAERAKQA